MLVHRAQLSADYSQIQYTTAHQKIRESPESAFYLFGNPTLNGHLWTPVRYVSAITVPQRFAASRRKQGIAIREEATPVLYK
eukprot:IDg4145t1